MMIVPGLCILVPHDGTRASAERLRRWYAEKIKPIAAVWSIEYGHHGTGYHLNIITEHIADIAPPGARVLTAPIRTTVRATAAYITKREQAPPDHNHRTRNTGYMGQVVDIMAKDAISMPTVQAAALQQQLLRTTTNQSPGAVHICAAEPQTARRGAHTTHAYTREQYHEFAKAGLANLYTTNERLNRARLSRLNGTINNAATAQLNPERTLTPPCEKIDKSAKPQSAHRTSSATRTAQAPPN